MILKKSRNFLLSKQRTLGLLYSEFNHSNGRMGKKTNGSSSVPRMYTAVRSSQKAEVEPGMVSTYLRLFSWKLLLRIYINEHQPTMMIIAAHQHLRFQKNFDPTHFMVCYEG
jgi:hypothetical protein